ncbi:hypothetical protein DA2_0650 [Desulfovibrio sp. A2]|nr:hypothetical protein DA2_0650 [Desulfovibrio sp. A2]
MNKITAGRITSASQNKNVTCVSRYLGHRTLPFSTHPPSLFLDAETCASND